MNHLYRYIGSASLLLCFAAAADASAFGAGKAGNTTTVMSLGSDVSWFTEPASVHNIGIQTGSGSSNAILKTDMPTSSSVHNFTASDENVPSGGEEYQLSAAYTDLFFTNNSTSDVESVTLSWKGFIKNFATAAGAGSQTWDYSQSSLLDANTDKFAFIVADEAYSGGTTSYHEHASGQYTFLLNPGQENEIQAYALNEGIAKSDAPAPAAVIPFALGLVRFARRKRAG